METAAQLENALNNGSNLPGCTIQMRAGLYEAAFTCSIIGTADSPIVVCNYPGETVIIDGELTINAGGYVTFRGIEFRYTGWTTRDEADVATQVAAGRSNRITVSAPGVKFVNCIIHDMRIGPYSGVQGVGLELYGNVIYHNGYIGADRGHGHSTYLQNNVTTRKVARNNIMFRSFSYGVHCYAESTGYLTAFDIQKNTLFDHGLIATGYTPRANILLGGWGVTATGADIANNRTYHQGAADNNQVGYEPGAVTDTTLTDNYMPDALDKVNATVTESGNYYGPDTGNVAYLEPNAYDANRAHLTIYNEAGADSVAMDVSAVFSAGQTVYAWNVQAGVDTDGVKQDNAEYTVAGDGTITIDMRAISHSVATPIGWDATPATTFPKFGCFVLEAA